MLRRAELNMANHRVICHSSAVSPSHALGTTKLMPREHLLGRQAVVGKHAVLQTNPTNMIEVPIHRSLGSALKEQLKSNGFLARNLMGPRNASVVLLDKRCIVSVALRPQVPGDGCEADNMEAQLAQITESVSYVRKPIEMEDADVDSDCESTDDDADTTYAEGNLVPSCDGSLWTTQCVNLLDGAASLGAPLADTALTSRSSEAPGLTKQSSHELTASMYRDAKAHYEDMMKKYYRSFARSCATNLSASVLAGVRASGVWTDADLGCLPS